MNIPVKNADRKNQEEVTIRIFVSGFICSIALLCFTSALAAPENLDEMMARKTRLPTASFSYLFLQDNANNYTWQPETLNYSDVTSSNEVWLFSSPAVRSNTQDISITHWSANGNRVLFHSKRSTKAVSYANGTNAVWMLSNTDGSRLKPAKGAAAQLATVDAYVLWSPILSDVLYQGWSNDGQSTAVNGFYKVQVSDATISRNLLLSVPGATKLQLKKAISGDGRKAVIKADSKLHPATVYPETSKGFETASGYSMLLNFDYWASPITSWVGYHDQFMSGAINGADGVWNYIMPENANGSWWRARTSGTGTDGAPYMVSSLTPPYNWGGELEPINSGGSLVALRPGPGYDNLTGKNPWCPTGTVPGTDCMEYFGHFAPDRWGRYGISSKAGVNPVGTSIADLRYHKYKVEAFTPPQAGGNTYYYTQHNDWEAWSDWSVSSKYPSTVNQLDGGIFTQNVNDVNSQKFLSSPYTRYNNLGVPSGTYEGLARPTQSPDGTKVMYNSTLLSNHDDTVQIFWTVAYYPYPPEIMGATKNGSNVRLKWDFNQGTSCSSDAGTTPRRGPNPNLTDPRTYATRGWPHETLDCPPSPREIDKFRVWVSTDNINWTPAGTTTYNNCRGTNECGMWTETAWTFDATQANSSTRYYAVTSLEYSGLESRSLSNVWKVTLDANGNLSQNYQESAYPSEPGDKSNFYSTKPLSPTDLAVTHKQSPATANGQYTITWKAPSIKNLIRYYNVYASDGTVPTSIQQSRIASVPATSDYAGSGNYKYIDWLGSVDGSTKYIVTSVDFQGNESFVMPTSAPRKNTTLQGSKTPATNISQ